MIPGIPIGAVLGGGRYDKLIAAAGGKDEPAVGMAFGLDRIIAAMDELSMGSVCESHNVLVYPMTDGAKKAAFLAAQHLRSANIGTDFLPLAVTPSDASSYAKQRGLCVSVSCACDGSYTVSQTQDGASPYVDRVNAVLALL